MINSALGAEQDRRGLEEQLGSTKYLCFHLICGVLAGLAQWLFSTTSDLPPLVASAAITGVMGAYFPNP